MGKGRLEAFSDGVLAIIITIMVLELKPPGGSDISALRPLLPSLLGYALSFAYIGIYWNNHHHMFQATPRINGKIMLANLYLLFWLSLVPIVTAWLGDYSAAPWPAALYGVTLFMAGFAYFILERVIIAYNGKASTLGLAVGSDRKGIASQVLYAVGIGLAFLAPRVSELIYALVAILWVVPDPRIEKQIEREPRTGVG